MPQARGLYLRVGALVVVGLALAVGFVLFFTATRFGTTSVTYETYSRESVQGLEIGAPVRYRGVSIGRVSEIGLVAAEYHPPRGEAFATAFQLVFIRFAVDLQRVGEVPSVEDAIRLGLRARIASQGITGVNYLELDFVNPDYYPAREVPWKPRYPYIPSIPSTVAQVQNAAEVLLRRLEGVDLQGLINNVVGLAADLRQQTRDGDLAIALREAAALLRTLHSAVSQANLPAVTEEVRGAAAAARGTATEAQTLLASPEIRQTLANLAATTAELRSVAGRLPGSLNTLDGTLRSARGATTDLQSELAPILRDLRAAISNLRDTTELLRRNPSQALFGAPPPQGPGR